MRYISCMRIIDKVLSKNKNYCCLSFKPANPVNHKIDFFSPVIRNNNRKQNRCVLCGVIVANECGNDALDE